MKIAIFGRLTENTDIGILRTFFAYLQERRISYAVYAPYARQLYKVAEVLRSYLTSGLFEEVSAVKAAKFVYSFGGDGTMLETIRMIGRLGKPILGVNFGRLGYLTTTTQRELIPVTNSLLKDAYMIDERSLLSVVSEPSGLFGSENYGVNDLTVHKSKTNEMITIHTYINGEFLNSYWGDGLIVSTPTGSTAYNLSCGGPIMFPNSSTFVITPVAPHSLTVRPVIIPDDWVVTFVVESRSGEAMVALDTRTELVKATTAIAVKRADFKVRLLRMPTTKYVENLRRSLMWGEDSRN